ncbi:hypothetical protein M406DRAFT_68101 [Cryphonectria parasitica EP155]|uniref:Uncharacterized protein n=1 Tax=Cryphonectria parasitica (strain ATCC 38755 / EP155) TaxID=660469 RepID=A0A9P5CQ54_CRYP1|nr:uncharacterized protein M406DRAFT_68101 [Cryphonectria parasitica EP155]KAF3765680.1 hypothetical protein M406DRAFT_68101 [Cryphonectria parasitica EP155]
MASSPPVLDDDSNTSSDSDSSALVSESDDPITQQDASPHDHDSQNVNHVIDGPTHAAKSSSSKSNLGTGTSVTKGAGPSLHTSNERRFRPPVTYNLKELSKKARLPSKSSPQKGLGKDSASGMPALKPLGSEPSPFTYNLKELYEHQITGQSKPTQHNAANPMEKGSRRLAPEVELPKRPLGEENGPEQLAKRPRVGHDVFMPTTLSEPGAFDKEVSRAQRQDSTAGRRQRNTSTAAGDVSNLVEYLRPILRRGGVPDPAGMLRLECFSTLVSLPQQRTIEWNAHHGLPWTYRHKIDITSLLVQITGERPPSPCERCEAGRGKYMGCFVISSAANTGSIYGCANCIYHGKQTFCSLKSWGKKKLRDGATSAPTATIAKDNAETDLGTRGASQQDAATASVHQNPVDKVAQTRPTSLKATPLVTAGILPGTVTMEPWERAPGRIRSVTSDKPESEYYHIRLDHTFNASNWLTLQDIAFSKAYLTSGSEVHPCKEATFRVEVICSGRSCYLQPQTGVTRLCSIAAGKLTVKIEGEEPFVIGPHGMFRITSHSTCLVESEVYDDVVLHITSIKTEDD